MLTLSDIALDLAAAEDQADTMRRRLHAVERSGRRDRIVEGRLSMTERRIVMLMRQAKAVLAAVDKLAGELTMLAAAGLDHDAAEMQALERRALNLLGAEPLDAERWPYAAAALRAREWPEDEEALVGFFVARQVLRAQGRAAA